MFKKAKDINPLPAGMADAFNAALSQQGFKSPVVEEPAVEVAPAPAVEADAELSESAGKRKADQADGDVAVPKAGDVTPEIGEIKTKAKRKLDKDVSDKPTALKASYSEAKTVKEDCEDCECEPCECDHNKDHEKIEEGTLPPALQKAIDKKNAKKDGKKVEDEDEDDEEVKEELDDVDQKAIKKKFVNRKDKDLDNDGDEDQSDKYLHRRRKAIAKALED